MGTQLVRPLDKDDNNNYVLVYSFVLTEQTTGNMTQVCFLLSNWITWLGRPFGGAICRPSAHCPPALDRTEGQGDPDKHPACPPRRWGTTAPTLNPVWGHAVGRPRFNQKGYSLPLPPPLLIWTTPKKSGRGWAGLKPIYIYCNPPWSRGGRY